MFSFASKMLNTLMGEGEGGPPGGPQPRLQGQVRPPYQQPGPRLQQMTYPRHPGHPSPQPILRESTFSHSNSHVDIEPHRRYSSGGPEEPNLDLSHLSAEERALIQNVMAKAKDLDTTQQNPIKSDNQFCSINNKTEDNRQNSFNISSGNYSSPQSMSFHSENFPQSQAIHKPQENFNQGNNMFKSNQDHFSQHTESNPYSKENFPKTGDNFQDLSPNLNQRFDNFQIKQELQSLQDNYSANQRKDFSLQRQESCNSAKQSTSYFNDSWENSKKDEVSRPGNIQQQDCEYSTPSPVSNSPDIRLSPSSLPASPSSEDSRTSLLATSKDEMKPHLPMESFYDHSPGEVYTIPEEEDEISSPTSDGVTSLRKRRLVGAQSIHKENGASMSSTLQSNHFRSNNNFSMLNQNMLKTNPSFGQIGNEPEKTNGNSLSNQDSFSSSQRQNDYMFESKHTSDLGDSRFQSTYLDKHPDRTGQAISNLLQHDSLANKHEQIEKHFQTTATIRPQLTDHHMQSQNFHGPSQQNSQLTQQQQIQPQQHIHQQQQHHLHQPQQQPLNLQQQPQQSIHIQQHQNVHQQQQHLQQQQQQQPQLLQQQQSQQLLQQQQSQQLLQQQTSQQQQSHLQSQQPHLQSQQPHLQSQQPHLQPQQPHLQSQQPHLQSQQPLLQSQQPHLQSQQSHLQSQQSHLQSQQPHQTQQMLIQQTQQIQQNHPINIQQGNQFQHQQPVTPNQLLQHNASQNQLEKKPQITSQHLQQNQMQQSNSQQQIRQPQQELQYLQMKKLQHLQRQQLHSRANSRTPLLQQSKTNVENNFQMMKPEAGFYAYEDSWRGYNEYPDDINIRQLYGKDFDFEQQIGHQKSRQQERALGFQNEMEIDSFNMQKHNSQQNNSQAKSSAGTISGMLADFSRALGLSNTSDEKTQEETNSHTSDTKELNQPQSQKSMSQQQIQAQIRANEQFIHGQQTHNPHDYQSSQHSQMSLETKELKNQNDQKTQSSSSNNYQTPQFQISQSQVQVDYNQLQQPNHQIQQFNQQNLIQQQKQQSLLKEDYLNSLDSEQKAMYIQQQLFQKLPEHQPMFAQNLTPQQQQMYQQHMQLQHHAQHLKKIKRSLPQSALDQQRQGQIQKKENNLNVMNQGLGTGVTIQQMMAAQFLGQQPIHPMQLMNSQIVGSDMKITNQSRIVSGSNPILVASGLTSQQLNSATPLGTPQSTPVGTPRGTRDGGDSSDTMSETDSQKSLRTRRKLPSIPSDQEAITLPNNKKRDGRVKAKSPHDKFGRSYSPLRFPEGGYRISSSNLMLQRPSSSETNLRKISNFGPETIPRPGSALGLLQGSSVVSSSGMHVDYNRDSEIASCLPPDLRYLLHSYKSSDPYSKQQFLQAYKEHVSGDVKLPDRRALNRLTSIDWETERLLSRNKDLLRNPKSRLDIQRKIAYSGIGRTRKLRTHRRQLSDPKIHLEMSPLKDGSETPYNRGYYGVAHPSLRPPYKSYEYESIDDGKLSEWDSSHPYLASYAIAGGALRETAINSVLDKEHMGADPMRYDMRRYSDSLDLRRRDVGKHHNKPRSWQPSPYGSDEEEDQLSREQKKAKIKAEIARRRQQIEENARLHEELLRLARLRESAELGYAPLGNAPTLTGDYAMSSVLKSIDDLIGREAEYTSHRTPEDRSMDRIASTFRTDDYTSGVYERLTDFSPVTDFSTPHAMPLLPDMPTRSRKLLEDLGSSPITDSVLGLPQKAKALL